MNNHINIVILGNLDTGKSSICSQLSAAERQTQPTTGIQETRLVRTYGSEQIDIKLIDTSGDPHFMDLIEPELLHADAILYVFSFNDQESYDDLNYWIELAEPFVDEYTTLMIVGNKSEDKNIGTNNPQQFAKQKQMLFTEVSALYKFGLEEMLKKVIESVFESRKNKSNKIVSSIDINVVKELKENKDTKKISIGIIGDPSIGNFRIFNKVTKQYNAKDSIESLITNSLSQKSEVIFPERKAIIQILDITDNQLKKLLTNSHFESPEILMIVFSVQSLRSFQNLETYFNMFDDNPNIIIVGTKSGSSKRQVSKEVLIKYAEQRIFKSFEISDKGSQQIENLINYILSLNISNNEKQQKQLSENQQKMGTTVQSQNQTKEISNKDSSNSSSPSSILLKILVGLGVFGVIAFAFTKYRK